MWNFFRRSNRSNKEIAQRLRWWYEHELGLIKEHKNLDMDAKDCRLTLRDHELLAMEIADILGEKYNSV